MQAAAASVGRYGWGGEISKACFRETDFPPKFLCAGVSREGWVGCIGGHGLVAAGHAIELQAAAAAPGGRPELLHTPGAGLVAAGPAIERQAAAAAPGGQPELLRALEAGPVAAGLAIELQAAAATPGGPPEPLHALDAGLVAAGQAIELQAAAAAPGAVASVLRPRADACTIKLQRAPARFYPFIRWRARREGPSD